MSRRLPAALLVGCLLLICLAVPALASGAPSWTIDSVHGPQSMPSGDNSNSTPEGQYAIQAYNIGDEETSGPYTVVDRLPPGVTVASPLPGGEWSCSTPGFPAAELTCTAAAAIAPPLANAEARGAAPPLLIPVSVAPGTSGTEANEATISGGGASAAATALDQTEFTKELPEGSTPTGFGFAPGSFVADLFDSSVANGADPALGVEARQAGSHPFELRVGFHMNLEFRRDPDSPDPETRSFTTPREHTKTLETRLPAGLIGNPQATPKCPGRLLNRNGVDAKITCPANTQVGIIDLVLNQSKVIFGLRLTNDVPVYNMVPPPGSVAALAFELVGHPVWILAEVDPSHAHSVVTRIPTQTDVLSLRQAELTLWGVPGDPAHDALRGNPDDPGKGVTAFGTPFTGAPVKPFLTLPGQCDTGGRIEQRADSWQHPGVFTPWAQGAEIKATGCEDPRLRFEPSISIQPTSHEAASPTGLDVDLSVPQSEDPEGLATPNVRTAVTHLPPGMAVNPSAADGLTGCSPAQIGLEDNDPVACPDSSKIGTVEIESPLMPETMHGFIYQAKQGENPFGSTLAFYTVAEGPGLIIKLAAKVEADPQTGDLTTTFADNPQLAFSHYRLHFFGGPRAPLVNPPTCGRFEGTASVSSWNSSLPVAHIGDTARITSGPNGSPCPNGLAGRPFAPSFKAGATDPLAGAFSPFGLEVARADGTQELRTIEVTLPAGLLARLRGVPYCSEAVLAAIPTAPGTGVGERSAPHCPPASRIGRLDAGAGAGPLPFHTPGSVYLAGPYEGAPLSLAIVTPLVGGPLDLGNVLTRVALYVDPETAQVRAVSDPLPRIVAGIPLNVRSVRVELDRERFTLNPTSCDPTAVSGRVDSVQGASAAVSDRFQVGGCRRLRFAPKLSLSLRGKTYRGGDPALRAVLKMGSGANIARAAVALPHSEFLDQAHIRTVCTRVQYAAGGGGGEQCPAGSVYGHATAWSPLLDKPLQGPVYLRSSSHNLPDLVASLDGQIHVNLDGRIDTTRGGGIRNTFEVVPDAPVTKFVLTMQGGGKGLLENSTDICRGAHRAIANFTAHNGKAHDLRPALRSRDCRARPGHPGGHR